MLVIRFSRVGKTKYPTYRVVISEKTKDPWGNYLELLGNYNPHTKKAVLRPERIQYWLSRGAQASETVHNLLIREGVIEAKKKKSSKISKKRQGKIEAKKATVAKAEEDKKAKAQAEKETAEVAKKASEEKPVEPAIEETPTTETPAETPEVTA